MNFLPKVSFNGTEDKGAELKKSVVGYCDKNDNALFDVETTDRFEKSSETNNPYDGNTDTFEKLSCKHDDEYYFSGTIPVAVIGNFDENSQDGINSCNVIKFVNPDVSITKFDSSEEVGSAPTVTDTFLSEHPLIDNFIYENQVLRDITETFRTPTQADAIEKCLDDILALQSQGAEYKAVNLSSCCSCSYPEINRLVIQETNVEITPENIDDYKSDIKEVLETKRERRILSPGNKVKVSQLMNIIKKTEELNIPVYMKGTYQQDDKTVFNLFALADNANYSEESQENPESFSESAALAKDMARYGIPSKAFYK